MAIRRTITSVIDFFHFPFLKFIPATTFRYLFCGVSTIVVDWVIFFICNNYIFHSPLQLNIQLPNGMGQIDEITAQTISLLCAFLGSFLWGFALNKYVVFTTSPLRGRIQLFRYAVIVGTCILFNYLLMNFFTLNMSMNAMVARVITSLIVAVYSYMIQRSFTFQVGKEINP